MRFLAYTHTVWNLVAKKNVASIVLVASVAMHVARNSCVYGNDKYSCLFVAFGVRVCLG